MRRALPLLLVSTALSLLARADDWPQWRGPLRDGVWRETGILSRFPAEGLPVRWRAPVGQGYSGPAVAAGRVFLMDRALNKDAPVDVRLDGTRRDKTDGSERVLCLDEPTGKVLWTHVYPCLYSIAYGTGPRATPTVHGDKLYALGAMGHLLCLESATGKVVWQKHFTKDYGADVPMYGHCSAPLVDGDRLIVMVGGKGQAVMALDRHSGRELWKSGSAIEPGYCAPFIATLCGKRQLVVWHVEALAGLEPESGKILWSHQRRIHAGMAISAPAIEGDRLAVSSHAEGAMMLEVKPGAAGPRVVWTASTGGAGIRNTMSTLLLVDNYLYAISLHGEMCCLKGDTGQRLWTTLQPTSGGDRPRDRYCTAFMVQHADAVFLFNERGDLVLARLRPAGYEEISRVHVLDPDMPASIGGRKVVWSHPAFANRSLYARNDREIVCVSLAAP